ncbi:MAG TPA: hypothetical protein DIU35_20330 [Candidatus Latescibacteria bacterium]|nr:hypothetical protein [Candidatus Latescibacterota bacterium]
MLGPKDYRVIYNWDGAPHGYSEVPQSMEDFLEKVYAPLVGTQVGALFWCIGEHAARWPSEVLEQLVDVNERTYESAYTYIHTENIRQMVERGEDPQKALIHYGRELGLRVYASVRMNDNHFNGAQVEDLEKMHHIEMTAMRRANPEWLLGDRTSEWFALSWDFSVPEIREHRFAHIEEVCTRYEWDGVELDWQRHAFHFDEDEAYRLRYLLTDLQRRVRAMTNELGEKRGQPFYLAARVAGSLEMCRRIGYDIPLWIEEGLVDVLIPAGGAGTDSLIGVSEFVEMCEGTGIAVYPGFDGGLPGAFVGPEDPDEKNRMRTRAIATRYHNAGADGIYAFNWHADRNTRRELLCQVGSLKTLRETDKIYAATHRFIQKEGEWRGAYRIDRIYGEVPVTLRKTATEMGPVITLDVGDEGLPRLAQVRIRLAEWVRGDIVKVKWDGDWLIDLEEKYCKVSDPNGISDVTGAVWLSKVLAPEQIRKGKHSVEILLMERNPRMACEIIVTDVELQIQH